MLVLSRKPGEKVVIGDTVTLILPSCHGRRIRIGITAPDDVCILRGELLDRQENLDPETLDGRRSGVECMEAP